MSDAFIKKIVFSQLSLSLLNEIEIFSLGKVSENESTKAIIFKIKTKTDKLIINCISMFLKENLNTLLSPDASSIIGKF